MMPRRRHLILVPHTETLRTTRTVAIPALAALTFINVLPQTLIVPVLNDIVGARFAVQSFESHLFMVVNMVGAVLAAPWAGALADRLGDRRRLMVAALLLDGFFLYALAIADTYPLLLVARFAEGAANIAGVSMCLAIAADEAKRLQRPRLFGLIGGSLTFGVAMGVPLGGVLGKIDPLLPLHVGAITTLATALAAALLLPRSQTRAGEAPAAEERRLLAREPRLLLPYAFAFVDRFTVGFFVSTFPIHLRTTLAVPPDQIGFLLALFLVPFSLLSWPMGRICERFSIGRIAILGSLVYGLLVLPVGVLSPTELVPLMFVLGVSASVMYVPTLVMTARLAPGDARAAAMGGFNAAGSLGFLVGPLVAGRCYDAFGAGGAFLVAGLSEIACALLLAPALARLERRLAPSSAAMRS